MWRLAAVLFGLALLASAQAAHGVDVSIAVAPPTWSCISQNGVTFTIVRAYLDSNEPDPIAATTVIAAWNGGIEYVDIYMVPCPSCGNGAHQVQSMISSLNTNNVHQGSPGQYKYGTVWIVVGDWGSNNQSYFQSFFEDVVAELQQQQQPTGVYTSSTWWSQVMGNSTIASSLPLWYMNFDNEDSFADFESFGGWSSPAIKQYESTGLCGGVGGSLNWHPLPAASQ